MKRRTRPRKTIQHFHDPGDLHELTFSCQDRRPLLTNDAWRMALAQFIDVSGEQFRFDLIAFVFMPEHVHLLVNPREEEPDIPGYLAGIKQRLATVAEADLQAHRSPLLARLTVRMPDGTDRFRYWLQGPGYDRNLRTQTAVRASIDYIHTNPVKRGLVRKNRQWNWSSARFYETDGQEYDPRCPRLQPLPAEFWDWHILQG